MTLSRTADELSALAVIETFSSAIKSNSPDSLRSLVIPSGTAIRAGTDSSGRTELVHITLSDLVEYISAAASKARIEGRFDPEEATVKSDGKLAVVWAPWKSYASGQLSHTGSLVFILAKEDGKWIIISNADSLVEV